MRKWIIGLIIVIIIIAGVGYYVQSIGGLAALFSSNTPAEATATPIVTTKPAIIVEAVVVPVRHADLSLPTSGVAAEVLVNEGDTVAADQPIARLENERQLIAIAQAEARVRGVQARLDELKAGARPEEIAAAQAAVDAARANLSRLVEGARPEDIAAAEAQLAAAEATLRQVLEGADEAELITALANLSNAEAALRQAQRAYDEVKWRNDVAALPQAAALEQATNNYEAAKARYDLLIEGAKESEIARAQAEVEQARAALDKARAPATASEIAAAEADVRRAQAELALRQAGARQETIRAAEADLMEAQTNLMQRQVELADAELRAPFAGAIAALNLKVGEQVAAGRAVAQLADFSDWLIETDDLTEIGVVDVREGQRALIRIDALPDLELTGRVLRIKPLGENKQGDITYTATIQLDQPDPRLRWKMTAEVTFAVEE